jgi:hypothetical protein
LKIEIDAFRRSAREEASSENCDAEQNGNSTGHEKNSN